MATTPPKKGAEVIRLLSRKRGATVDELIKATGWKRASVMSRLSWLKRNGYEVEHIDDKGDRYHATPVSKPDSQ